MWSPNGQARNRVSPVQLTKHGSAKQNGYSKQNGHARQNGVSNSYGSDVQSTKSKSGVHIDVKRTAKTETNDLTRLIRRRKTEHLENARVGQILNTRTQENKWTPNLTDRLKNKLFEKPVKPVKGWEAWKYRRKQNFRKLKLNLKEIGYKLELWRSWFKRIEGHQGTGVLSYFVFLKWIMYLNIYLFLILFLFVVIPGVALDSNGYTTKVLGTGVSGASTLNVDNCSANYTAVSSSGIDVIQDFIQGTGWMEKTALFYGYYNSVELDIGGGTYLFPLAYFLSSLSVLFLSLVLMARFTIASFKENLYEETSSEKTDYCNKVFGGWDYALDEQATCDAKKKSILKDIAAHLDHQKYILTRSERTSCQRCKTYTIRFLINFLILCMLGGAGYLIYWVNQWSTEYLTGDSSGSFVVLLVEFLPSLTITVLNVLIPLIFGVLVTFEDYTEEFVIKITLIRTVFLRLASLAVLLVSLYVNIKSYVDLSCSDKHTKCDAGDASCTAIKCWETYVGQAFYKLLVLDYFVHIVAVFCYELPRKLFTTKCSSKICAKIGPAEFDVSKNVLDLVYTQALCWIGFLFCPLIPTIAFISTFTQFYLKLFSALYTTVPPEKPYKASKSNNFFMIVLMITFFLCCFPVGYSMVRIQPSDGCGPFRIYTDMSVCVDTTISSFDDWLQDAIELLTSNSMIVSIITILCLTIYYLYVRGKAYNERGEIMKEQLVMEGKDKQFLLAKIYQISGEGPQQKAKPKPRILPPTVRTENEIPSEDDTKKFVRDDVPQPPAYEDKSEWDEAPIVLAVGSPPTDPNNTDLVKSPSPKLISPKPDSPKTEPTKKTKKSNLKSSKVTPSVVQYEGPPSNMPFDF